jgi:hypothetical protein
LALAAARFYLDQTPKVTQAEAARAHGSCVTYLQAALVVIQANDAKLLDAVLHGRASLLAAAELMGPRVRAIEAFQAADPASRRAVLTALGYGAGEVQ